MKFTFDLIKGDFGWYHQAKGINLLMSIEELVENEKN